MRSSLIFARASLFALLFATTNGCFAEVDDPPAGTGPSCDPGTLGCECANGLCSTDLECAPANICTPLNCQPGSAICECAPGEQCDGDLICNTGVCLPMTTGTTTDNPTTSQGPTSSSATTAVTITTTGDPTTDSMTESTTVSMTTSNDDSTTVSSESEDSSSTTEGLVDCASISQPMNSCAACFSCTEDPGQPCQTLGDVCLDIPGCPEINQCLSNCKGDGQCFGDCCEGHAPDVIMAARALSQCHQDNCGSMFCLEFLDAECSGG